jgi:iron complex outermembrane recepter protein
MKLLLHYVLRQNSVVVELHEVQQHCPVAMTYASLGRKGCERYRMRALIRAVLLGAVSVFAAMCFVPFSMSQSLPGSQADSPEAHPAPDEAAKDVASMDLEHLAQADVVVPAFSQEVVSVTGTESTIGRSPAAVYVITEEMIRRSGVTTLPEALRLAPGLDVARIDANKWAISSRGFNGRYANKLLVLLDGRSVYTPGFAGVFWETLDYPLQDIDHIEVIRGPGATVWGENAVNGVINIITKNTRDTQGSLIASGGGNVDTTINAARHGGVLAQDVTYRVYAKQFERDRFAGVLLPAEDDGRMQRCGFRIDGDLDKCDCDSFMLQGDIYTGTMGENGFIAQPPPTFVSTYTNDDQLGGGHILGRWTHKISEEESTALQAFYDRTQRDLFIADVVYDTFDVNFQHDVRLNAIHKAIWGWEYRSMRVNALTNDPFVYQTEPPEVDIQRVGGFLMDEMSLIDDELTFYIGSRISYNTFTKVEVQPTARLLWAITDRQIAWAAVSRAVRVPSASDRGVRFTAFTPDPVPSYLVYEGNPSVASENLIAYEIGYREQTTKSFSWDVTVFYNHYTDLIGNEVTAIVPGPIPTIVNTFANNTTTDTAGVEWSATTSMTDAWRLTSWYSFQGNVDTLRCPSNQAFLMSSWDLPHRVEFDLIGRYVDSISTLGVPSYISLDARLGWRPTANLELSVVGQNLLDQDRLEFVDRDTAVATTAVPRGVYGQIVWRY